MRTVRAIAESLTLWNQHNVGDAGFRAEQSYAAYYRIDDRYGAASPLFYVPMVRGTLALNAAWALANTHGDVAHTIEIHYPNGRILRFDNDDVRGLWG